MFKTARFNHMIHLWKSWSLFEILWLLIFLSIGGVITFVQQNTWFNFAVLLSGILCVVLAAKGNILNYVFGLFNSCSYAWICYQNGLYGEMGLNLFFFVPTALIGIWLWKKHTQTTQLQIARSISFKQLSIIMLLNLIGITILGFALMQISSQNNPFIDATTNLLAITATILMLYRFKEQWWFYIALNLLSILLWAFRTMDGSGDGVMMLLMWTAFLINAIYGFYNWHRLAKIKPVSA